MVPASSKEFLDIQANYRVYIHSETRAWHDNNIQANAPYRSTQNTAQSLNQFGKMVKCLFFDLSGSGFKSPCCHLNFRYGTSFE